MTTPSGAGCRGGPASPITTLITTRKSAVAQMRRANTGSGSISIQCVQPWLQPSSLRQVWKTWIGSHGVQRQPSSCIQQNFTSGWRASARLSKRENRSSFRPSWLILMAKQLPIARLRYGPCRADGNRSTACGYSSMKSHKTALLSRAPALSHVPLWPKKAEFTASLRLFMTTRSGRMKPKWLSGSPAVICLPAEIWRRTKPSWFRIDVYIIRVKLHKYLFRLRFIPPQESWLCVAQASSRLSTFIWMGQHIRCAFLSKKHGCQIFTCKWILLAPPSVRVSQQALAGQLCSQPSVRHTRPEISVFRSRRCLARLRLPRHRSKQLWLLADWPMSGWRYKTPPETRSPVARSRWLRLMNQSCRWLIISWRIPSRLSTGWGRWKLQIIICGVVWGWLQQMNWLELMSSTANKSWNCHWAEGLTVILSCFNPEWRRILSVLWPHLKSKVQNRSPFVRTSMHSPFLLQRFGPIPVDLRKSDSNCPTISLAIAWWPSPFPVARSSAPVRRRLPRENS